MLLLSANVRKETECVAIGQFAFMPFCAIIRFAAFTDAKAATRLLFAKANVKTSEQPKAERLQSEK